jgi:hypothetical protein
MHASINIFIIYIYIYIYLHTWRVVDMMTDALLMNEIFDSIVTKLGIDNEALLSLSRTIFLEYCRSVSDPSRLSDHAQYIAAASIYASSRSSGDSEIPPVTFSSLALRCSLKYVFPSPPTLYTQTYMWHTGVDFGLLLPLIAMTDHQV